MIVPSHVVLLIVELSMANARVAEMLATQFRNFPRLNTVSRLHRLIQVRI